MNSESARIADQLRRAFGGDAWHGPSLSDLLAGVTAEKARARPLASVHSIWELVLHIDIYSQVGFSATEGLPMPQLYGTGGDWPALLEDSEAAWIAAQDRLFRNAEKLAEAIERFDDAKLQEIVPGRSYDSIICFTVSCSTACITAAKSPC